MKLLLENLPPSLQNQRETLAEVYFMDRYPGFDFDDHDWPRLRQQVEEVGLLLETVKKHILTKS